LPTCIELAVQQSRAPEEVIIIDASDNWEEVRERILPGLREKAPEIRWVYEGAKTRGIPAQRNQGLDKAETDILFFFDDDTLMFPGCAERILELYEADSQAKVAGVCPVEKGRPPEGAKVEDERKEMGGSDVESAPPGSPSVVKRLKRFLMNQVFLMNAEMLFVPYDMSYPQYELPEALVRRGAQPCALMQGFRMTYRRSAIEQSRFEGNLLKYAAGEDLDGSYRASRHGMILELPAAKVHHFTSASGRINRGTVIALSVANQAFCIRKHAEQQVQVRRRFYRLMFRRVPAEFLKDFCSRRFRLPQMWGLLRGIGLAGRIFRSSEEDFLETFHQIQQELFRS